VLTNGDGKIVGTLSSGEDITERQRTEEVVSAIFELHFTPGCGHRFGAET
jgi:hypothetical protein